MRVLKRYQVHFGLEASGEKPQEEDADNVEPTSSSVLSKTELVAAVSKHFSKHPKFKESEVIAEFLHKIRMENEYLQQLNAASAPNPEDNGT